MWPAIPDPPTAQFLALCYQLDATQWWPAAHLRRHQEQQLAGLVAHAAATVPHYRDAFARAGYRAEDGVGEAAWPRVPILARQDLIDAGVRMRSSAPPPSHGKLQEVSTSRTSGTPVRVHASALVTALWEAITLREHLWHRRDLTAKLGVIRHMTSARAEPPDGLHAHGWGTATQVFEPGAPVAALTVASTTDQQVAWLVRENPTYLLVYPTVLAAICRQLQRTGERVPALREVRTISELLPDATRALCREVLGVPIADTYSAQELGYIALQCPDRPEGDERYHVQAERVFAEILRPDGTPCGPGEIGRVVLTDLHNFATPLVRYEIGDFAEVAEPCSCGRGLPTLRRVVGRRRGMLVYPDGRTAWPVFSVAAREATRFRDLQLVQDAVDALRVRVVPEPDFALDEDERRALIAALHRVLGHPFPITVEVVDELARSPAGKLEEFVSHVVR